MRWQGPTLVAVACAAGAYALAARRDAGWGADGEWAPVYSDSSVRVSLNVARITRRRDGSHAVLYRTDHAQPHVWRDRAWNREIAETVVRCDTRVYKSRRAQLSMDGGSPVSRQALSDSELRDQAWRGIPSGSADDLAIRAACAHVASVR